MIEGEVARYFHSEKEYIRDLRKVYMEDGNILVYSSNVRGGAADNSNVSTNEKVTKSIRNELVKMINEKHSIDKAIVTRDDVAYSLEKSI